MTDRRPNPRTQQEQAHALGAGVSNRLAKEYRGAVDVASKKIEDLAMAAQARRDAGLPVPPSWMLTQTHYREMRDQMNAQLARLGATTAQEVINGKRDAVTLAQTHAADWIGQDFRDLPTTAVEQIVRQIHNSRPNTPLGAALGRYPRDVNKKMESILVQAVALGLGPREAVKMFQQQMAGPFRNYDNLARTEIMGAYTTSSIASYRENREHLDGWEWVVEKSGALCPFCAERDGKVYPVTEDFKSHPSCRCTTIPKVKDKSPVVPPPPDPVKPPKPKKETNATRGYDKTGRPVKKPGETDQEFVARLNAWYTAKQNLRQSGSSGARGKGFIGYELAMPEEIIRLRKEVAILSNQSIGARLRARDEAHRLLELATNEQAHFGVQRGSFGSALPKAIDTIMERANEARDWMQTHVHRDVLNGNTVRVHYEPDRAFYRGGGIYMGPRNGVAIDVHEMGHWIEDIHDDILEQSKYFLQRRSTSSSPQWLGQLTGNSAYGRSEVAYPDTFIDPYVGKVYGGASEVLSMGMEEMYRDPVGFAQRDPDHFELTLAAMRGTTKTNTRRRSK